MQRDDVRAVPGRRAGQPRQGTRRHDRKMRTQRQVGTRVDGN